MWAVLVLYCKSASITKVYHQSKTQHSDIREKQQKCVTCIMAPPHLTRETDFSIVTPYNHGFTLEKRHGRRSSIIRDHHSHLWKEEYSPPWGFSCGCNQRKFWLQLVATMHTDRCNVCAGKVRESWVLQAGENSHSYQTLRHLEQSTLT